MMATIRRAALMVAALLVASLAAAQQTVFLSTTTNREVWRGPAAGAGFGTYLDRGEINADDLRRDLIVGAPAWNGNQGRVYVVFSGPVRGGTQPASLADLVFTGGLPGDRFGAATAAGWITTKELGLPQLSRDLVIAAPDANGGAGAVYLFRRGFLNGQTFSPASATLTILGAPGDHLGSALATGDLDGDGYREIFAGAAGNNRVYVIKGGPTVAGTVNPATQAAMIRVDGPAGAGVGSVLAAGDIAGDISYDMAIGAPDLAPAGAVFVVNGCNVTTTCTGGFPSVINLATGSSEVFTGIDAGDRAGASLAIGPYDGDTKMDLMVGAPNAAGPANTRAGAGEVYAVWGATALASRALSSANFVIYGLAAGWHAGAALSLGDVDRNPPQDLAILASGATNGLGDVYVVLGRPRASFPAQWDLSGGWDRRVVGDTTGPIQSVLVYDHTGEGAEDVVAGVPSAGEGLVYVSFSPLPESLMSYPANGQVLGGITAPFQWAPAANAEAYRLSIGTAPGANNILETGELPNTLTAFPMPSMPSSVTLFARIWTKVAGTFHFKDSTFSLLPAPVFTFPSDHLSGVQAGFFSWSPVAAGSVYDLTIGSVPGASDILDSGPMTATTLFHVFSLPSSRTLFARITATTGGASNSSDISFTTAPGGTGGGADSIGRGIGTNFGGTAGGDAFLYKPSTGTWSMQLSDANGFTGINSAVWAPGWTIQSGDFNGDGLSDLFLYNPTNGQWFKAISIGGGNFGFAGGRWAPGWTPTLIDFDGDGRTDVFLYNKTNGQWFRCMSVSDFGDFVYVNGLWAPGWTVYTADFNGDGRGDLFIYNRNATTDANNGLWFRVITQPDLSFAYLPGEVRWANNWNVTPADFNGDGQTDLFLYNNTSGQYFRVVWVNGVTTYDSGRWAPGWTLTRGDFNADGLADLFLYNPTNGQWFVVLTQRDGTLNYLGGLWAPNWQLTASDFNADGQTDLILYNPTSGQWFQATTLIPGSFTFTTGNWGTGWTVIAGRTITP